MVRGRRGPRGSNDEFKRELTGKEWLSIFKYMKRKYLFFLSLLLNAVVSTNVYILSVIQGKLVTALVETYYNSSEEFIHRVDSIANLLLLAVFFILISQFSSFFVDSWYVPLFLHDLKYEICRSILEQDMTFFDTVPSGVILSRVTSDVENAQRSYSIRLIFLIKSIISFISGIVVTFPLSPGIALIALGCLPLTAFAKRVGDSFMDKLWIEFSDKETDVAAKAAEILTSLRTVRSFDAERREYENYKRLLEEVHKISKKTSYIQGLKEFVSSMCQWCTNTLVLFVSGWKAAKGEIEPGTIVVFMTVLNHWAFCFSELFQQSSLLKKSNVSSAKILEITERVPKIRNDVGREIHDVSGKIEFRNVHFKYESRDKEALCGLSFVVEPNTTVAIVGESGCGKSTILQLIERFYDVSSGGVYIDDIDIREIKPTSLRRYISYVQQSPCMFSMSVKNNIRFGRPEAHRDEVVNAAKVANAHDFITQLSDGYKTEVNQNSLSGGQKQRICIARSVICNAPILLLDEATAALDAESERLVQNAISNYRVGKTCIIVAHRLSTVRHADKIIVIENGVVAEEGKHEELLERDGPYANLVRNQLQ